MKLRIYTRSLPSSPNFNRTIPRHTLHSPCRYSIFICSPHFSRRKLRMVTTKYPCQRKLMILHLPVPPCRPRPVLRILFDSRNLKYWGNHSYYSNGHSLYRIRPSLRANKLLRGHRNHQPILSHPLYWENTRRMTLRRLRRRQCNPKPIFRPSLLDALSNHRGRHTPPPIPPSNRIKQPSWCKLQLQKSPIPCILYNKRHHRVPYHTPILNNSCYIYT